MPRAPKKSFGGKWSEHAFPAEANAKFDEFDRDYVIAQKAEIEKDFAVEAWEVVDGLKFPYDQLS